MANPGPNEPCRCGSGRRYKRCCAQADRAAAKQRRTIGWVAVAVVVVGGLAFALDAVRRGGGTSGETAYRYDAANDRYWHEEHGHWHDGPPPDYDPGLLDPSQLPEPWEYDADGHRHWHPDHKHWHDGFPPPEAGAAVPFIGPGTRPPDAPPLPAPSAAPIRPAPPPTEPDEYATSEQELESDPG